MSGAYDLSATATLFDKRCADGPTLSCFSGFEKFSPHTHTHDKKLKFMIILYSDRGEF